MDLALAIHVLRKSRRLLLLNLGLMLLTAVGFFVWSPIRETAEMYGGLLRLYPMVASLSMALFAFHFTEGSRRAGFGSFPTRLFVLPISSFRLVAIPMALGVVTVMAVYLVWAKWILPMVHVQLKLLWPSMFAAAACLGLQALVWGLARFQTAKLFALGVFGTLLACSWVLLMEEMATALVLAITPSLSVEQAVPLYLGSVVLACFLTGLVAVYRQRHRSFSSGRGTLGALWKKLAVRIERRGKLASPEAALFWHEWRLMGRVFPMCVAIVCGLMLLLSSGIGTVTATATVNVMLILGFAPITLAGVLGSEFGKPNFWSKGLVPLPYLLTQPVAHSSYVMARVKVAAVSAAVAWGITAVSLTIWVSVFADASVAGWLRNVVGMSYDSFAWLGLVGFLLLMGMVVTMRLLCGNMWMTMLGSSSFYGFAGTARGVFGLTLLLILIFVPDWRGDRAWLANSLYWLSLGLCVMGVLHGAACIVVWSRVIEAEKAAARQFRNVWMAVALAVGLFAWLGYVSVTEVDWFRLVFWQLALWCFPLLATGLGIAARMKGQGAMPKPAWRIGPAALGVGWIGIAVWLGYQTMQALPITAAAGGHEVRMVVRGSGKPVVVLEQFGPGPLEPWMKIQNRVAEFATVVTYEHAGGMASGFAFPPRDAKSIARELRDALRSAGLEPPFVMVGYSFGGPYVRVFAGQFPDEVAGLVLVDPSTEEFFEWLWKTDPKSRISARNKQMQNEMGMVEQSFKQAADAGIPQLPTVVLTGGKARDSVTGRQSMPRWIASHSNWVAQLPQGRHVVSKKSGHAIPFMEPDRVVEVIRELVESLPSSDE